MGNIIDYIQWRGDLTFSQSPFNEVDSLILSCLAYVNMDRIENVKNDHSMILAEVSEQFFAVHTQEELQADKSFVRRAPYLMRHMAASERFGNCIVRNYVSETIADEEQQFSAMEILLEDGTSFVAFRGTDDTVIGWKEDFRLSNGTVPAQLRAMEYMNAIGWKTSRPLRVGGHSKGGNLAIYAAVKCDSFVRENIIEIYNHDGPGFAGDIISEDEMMQISARVKKYVPEFSIIGLLLEDTTKPEILISDEKNIQQHDAFSWAVSGPAFVRAEKLNKNAVMFIEILHKWIAQMDVQQRDKLIDELFAVIEASELETLTQIQDGGIKSYTAMFKALEKISPDSRIIIQELLAALFTGFIERMHGDTLEKLPFFLEKRQ